MRSWITRLVTGRRTRSVAAVVFWVAVVALMWPLAQQLTDAQKNDPESYLPSDAESTQVLMVQQARTPKNVLPAVVVYERDGTLTASDQAKLLADANALGGVPGRYGSVVGPIPAQDRRAARIVVPVDLGTAGWAAAPDRLADIRAVTGTDTDGLSVYVTGPLAAAADSDEAFAGIDTSLLYGTVAVVVVILLLTYRSPVLWLLPIISSGVALTVAQAVIYLLARHGGLVVNAQSAGILTVLVFGAGTDYALLLVARYREELRRHADRHEAMAVALRRASPAILASAATVIAGTLCLLLAQTNATKGLGPVAAIGIAVGVLVMLTLLPALLVTVGRWIFWPVRPRYGTVEPNAAGAWARMGARIARRPRLIWLVTVLVLALGALGIGQLDANGLTQKESFRDTVDSVVGEEVLARHFPAGAGSPVVVISRPAQAAAVQAAFAATPGIVAGTVSQPEPTGDYLLTQGTLDAAPDSQEAFDTVTRVRAAVHAVPEAGALVGGTTATNLDVREAAAADRDLIIPVVLAVILLILALLLRALLEPVLLILTVVLSFAATLGISALVFRHVFGFAGADTATPLYIFVFLVALGVDYNIFLVTRVREESAKHGTRRAAVIGLAATGGVITSAGAVLAGTFAVLTTLPLTAFAEIGFAVAFGVLLDTIVVRSVLVTALNQDIGRHIWWPGRLSRRDGVARPAPAPASAPKLVEAAD